MANKVLVEIYNYDAVAGLDDAVLVCPLVDNITITGKSNYTSLGKLIPLPIDSIKEKMQGIAGATGMTPGKGLVGLGNKFDVPIWNGTDPLQISCKLAFYTKDDPVKDVFFPCKALQAQTILSTDPSGNYILPGVSMKTFKYLSATGMPNTREGLRNSKLIGFEIPGVIYIPTAFVESANPTFSKEVTKSGAPLWATVDLQIKSTQPATTEYYDNVFESVFGQTFASTNIKEPTKRIF